MTATFAAWRTSSATPRSGGDIHAVRSTLWRLPPSSGRPGIAKRDVDRAQEDGRFSVLHEVTLEDRAVGILERRLTHGQRQRSLVTRTERVFEETGTSGTPERDAVRGTEDASVASAVTG